MELQLFNSLKNSITKIVLQSDQTINIIYVGQLFMIIFILIIYDQ